MEHKLTANLSRNSTLIFLLVIVWLGFTYASYKWNNGLIEHAVIPLANEQIISEASEQSAPIVKPSAQQVALDTLQRQNIITHISIFILLSLISTIALWRIEQLLSSVAAQKKLRDEMMAKKTQSLKQEIKQHKIARNELQRLATHDPLTGLRNKRHFIESLDKELNRYQRYQSHFSILLLDIDNFSQVNDAHGHDCGDYVLQQFAKTISQTLRQSDIFVRYGGEEFAIITTSSQLDSAIRFAEKLISHVNDMAINYQANKISITVSIGVSSPSQLDKPNSQLLVAMADKALHLAKSNGRNMVMTTSEVLS
ncbi:MAG: GGDEF domain-containing protein [Gammaproteobacteria bacterium]|nr:GGDEF domain-containing protein [Gammaproteobacteria bacterium]